jgi:hypothetical protein
MIERIFDTGPLTGLINNAAGNFISRTEDLSPRGFDAVANTVMHGTFYVTQAVGKRWIDAGLKGSVLSIIVTWVWTGSPFVVPSAMSKAGIDVMTKSLAVEWGRYGIRLNAIAPGIFPTEGACARLRPVGGLPSKESTQNPMGRLGRMDELGDLAAFLMAPDCEWLTGQTIAIDGANWLANGAYFTQYMAWGDAEWGEARARIKEHNDRDKAQRRASPNRAEAGQRRIGCFEAPSARACRWIRRSVSASATANGKPSRPPRSSISSASTSRSSILGSDQALAIRFMTCG